MYNIDLDLLPTISYDTNGNMLVNGVPIPNTPPVILDNNTLTNAAGLPYVPSGVQGGAPGDPAPSLDVDYTDAMAILNSSFLSKKSGSGPSLTILI